jgi:hypothetical protein
MKAEELPNKLNLLADEFADIFAKAPDVATQELLGSYLQRIFNDGKLTNGGNIGQYTPGRYKALRNKEGKRIDKVDLQFTGDLFRSIDRGTLGVDSVIGFTNAERKKIADHLETRYGDVFTASVEEKEEATLLMEEYIAERTNEILKRLF